ncbi:hypothetical protein NF419_03000 [Streptococcus suis]|nr:hypothetical protein [Streptococcus suis]
MPVQVSCQLDDRTFALNIGLAEQLSAEKQEAILAYVEEKCKVKALFSDDINYHIEFGLLG